MSAVANGSRAVVVLVVEDEWLVRRCIADFLHEAGCVVVEAENGERAIHICNSGIPVDVLFTDINLNGSADGWVVAESFRNARDNIPVIYASGNPIDEARCVPGSVHFHKPYRPEDILCACVLLKDSIATRKVDSAGDGMVAPLSGGGRSELVYVYRARPGIGEQHCTLPSSGPHLGTGKV